MLPENTSLAELSNLFFNKVHTHSVYYTLDLNLHHTK